MFQAYHMLYDISKISGERECGSSANIIIFDDGQMPVL